MACPNFKNGLSPLGVKKKKNTKLEQIKWNVKMCMSYNL
jgi:hypothetical protein